MSETRSERTFKRNDQFTYTRQMPPGRSGVVLIGGRNTQKPDQAVVIKQANPDAAPPTRAMQAESIWRESEALCVLHENGEERVCRVLDRYKDENRDGVITDAYMVTTHAAGETLEAIAKAYHKPGSAIAWAEFVHIASEVTGLLSAAHEARLIHNDVKLDHVFWVRDEAKLTFIDWGNVNTNEASPQDDIKQLGEILYEAIREQRPAADNPDFGGLEMPAGLDAAIIRALKGGYDAMADLHQDLRRIWRSLDDHAKSELHRFEAQIKGATSQTALDRIRAEINAWPARPAYRRQVGDLLGAIETMTDQIRFNEQWDRAQAYLKARDYDDAYPLLQSLISAGDAFAAGGDFDLELIATLTHELAQLPDPPEEVDAVLEDLMAGRRKRALRYVCTLVAQYSGQHRLVYVALWDLSRALDIPAVYGNLNGLLRILDEQIAAESNRDRRIEFDTIARDLEERIEDYRVHGEWDLGALCELYATATETLESVGRRLDGLEVGELKARSDRLVQGAIAIAEHLEAARTAQRNEDDKTLDVELQKAVELDPTYRPLWDLNVPTASAAEAQLAELDVWTIRGMDDVPELLEAYFDVLDRAPSIARFAQQLVALNGLQDAWERFGAASSTVERGETLDAALDLAGSFPPIQSFLMGLREKGVGAPWDECRPPVAEQISAGVRAWQDAKLTGPKGASRIYEDAYIGRKKRDADQAKWLSWLNGLIQAVNALEDGDVDEAQNWIDSLQTIYRSEETRFLEHWLTALRSYQGNQFSEADKWLSKLMADLAPGAVYGHLSAYKEHLRILEGCVDAAAARKAVVLRLQAGDWDKAQVAVEDLPQSSDLDGELAAYQTALQQLAQAEGEVARGHYDAARTSLQAGREAVAVYVSEDGGRKLSNHLSDYLNHVGKVRDLIKQAQDRMVSVPHPDAMRWDVLTRCLREVKEVLPDGVGDERIEQYLTMHEALEREYENGHDAYAEILTSWAGEAPNHPFLVIYEQWQPPKTLADYLADAKGLIRQQHVPEAYEILCGLDGEPGYQDTAAPRCCEVVEAARVAVRAGTRGNYHTAREKLRQAEGALTSIRDGDLRREMQAWLTPIREALNNAADLLSEAVREMDDVARILEMHWAQLDRPLVRAIGKIEAVLRDSNVWSPVPDNLLETLAYQRHFHNKLLDDHKGGNRPAYVKDLQAFVDRYPNHAYRPLYERWIPEEKPETAAFPVWGWGVVGLVIVLGFVAVSVLSGSLNILGAGSTPVVTPSVAPTATPRPTWTPLPKEMMEDQVADLAENCGPIRADYEAEAWEGLLNKVDAVAETMGEDLPQVAAEIGEACDLAAMVAEAGRTGAKAKYEAENYGMAESITTQALGQLDTLRTTMAIDTAAYRDLMILQGCARMRAHRFMIEGAEMSEEDRAVAREAFEALAAMSAETGFYNDVAQLCGFSYPDAEAAFEGDSETDVTSNAGSGEEATEAVSTSQLPAATSEPQCQPKAPTNRIPANEDTLYAGYHDQKFAWMDGALCKGQVWQLVIDGKPGDCSPFTTPGEETTCTLPLDIDANHHWRVRAVWQADGRPVEPSVASEAWLFRVQPVGGPDCSKDSDGDGLNDCDDQCPNEPGSTRGGKDGCPD